LPGIWPVQPGRDYRLTLIIAGTLFLPAAAVAWFLPELKD
jgi:hypothetical protein